MNKTFIGGLGHNDHVTKAVTRDLNRILRVAKTKTTFIDGLSYN